MVGSFEGRLKSGKLEVSDLRGDPECEDIITRHARLLGLALTDREEARLSDWEIMDFYQRTHPGLYGG